MNVDATNPCRQKSCTSRNRAHNGDMNHGSSASSNLLNVFSSSHAVDDPVRPSLREQDVVHCTNRRTPDISQRSSRNHHVTSRHQSDKERGQCGILVLKSKHDLHALQNLRPGGTVGKSRKSATSVPVEAASEESSKKSNMIFAAFSPNVFPSATKAAILALFSNEKFKLKNWRQPPSMTRDELYPFWCYNCQDAFTD